MLSLIKDNTTIVTKEIPENTKFVIPDEGIFVSPAYNGWVLDTYSLMTIADADPIPAGKRAAFVDVAMVDGVPKYVNTLEDIPGPTTDDVNVERDRRIAAGFVYNSKLFDFDISSKIRISGAYQKAVVAVTNGAQAGDLYWHLTADEKADPVTNQPFGWICHDNSVMALDAQSMIEMGNAAFSWENDHVRAAYAIKQMDPIPTDFATDATLWP